MKGMGNDLLREARLRRGLTQAALAERAGTTQSAIARLESGRTAPSFDDVIRLLRLMELDLDFMLVERDDSDWIQAERLRGLDSSTLHDGLVQFAATLDEHRAERHRSVA